MMKDVPPEYRTDLPPCPFSVHCLRLLEDLAKKNISLQDEAVLVADDAQDRQLRIQLLEHLPGCPTCMAIVADGYAVRSWQRQQLRRVLADSEQMVPSVVSRIMSAIAQERETFPEKLTNGHKKVPAEAVLSPIYLNGVPPRPARRAQKVLQKVWVLGAVAAIIIASFTLFNNMLLFHSGSTSGSSTLSTPKSAVTSVTHTAAWSSVILAQVSGGRKIITSTDPVTGRSVILASSSYPDTTIVDGVSHDGYQILYHVFDGSVTRYYLWSSAQNEVFYTVVGKGGQALWNTDDSAIFIGTTEGIEQVAVSSHTAALVAAFITAPDLRFYRDGSLYFATTTKAGASIWLNRFDLAKRIIVPLTRGKCEVTYDFWLSPGGKIVYYRCKGQEALLYAVGSDGTGMRMVRANAGRIIGYTAQGEPLTLLKVNTTFQVVKLGVDVSQDKTVVADVASGASDLVAEDVAVAPYGFSLLAQAHYADGTTKVWYDDLTLGRNNAVTALFNVPSLQPVGWCRLQVSAGASK